MVLSIIFFTPNLGEDEPILTSNIFFKGGLVKNHQLYNWVGGHPCRMSEFFFELPFGYILLPIGSMYIWYIYLHLPIKRQPSM